MKKRNWTRLAAAALVIAISGLQVQTVVAKDNDKNDSRGGDDDRDGGRKRAKAKNVILFIGDGMGVSTIAATRVFSVGVAGELVVDKFPYTALSRTYSEDSITPDSAPTMSAMMTGINTNQSVIGFGENTEPNDFNGDGDGPANWTMLELAKKRGMKVGVVSTARITHATPAATYAHINQRNNENEIAAQTLPTDATYNKRLGRGIDVIMGGGRRFFVPNGLADEEGENGSRTDLRDLRAEFQAAGYKYVWNKTDFDSLKRSDLPVLGLFERDHMEYEYDRPTDQGKEPSIADMTAKSIDLLQGSGRDKDGFFLMVEAGRIDHAHHEGNAYRAITDTVALNEAILAALKRVDLRDTLILVSADHSHVFNIAGYPMRPLQELPYTPTGYSPDYPNAQTHGNGILDVVFDLNQTTGVVEESTDSNGTPYTALGYHNGPGYRNGPRLDPRTDPFPGKGGLVPSGPWDPQYFPESAVPMGSETHSGEDVAIYGAGAGSDMVRGTVKNTFIFEVMKEALGF